MWSAILNSKFTRKLYEFNRLFQSPVSSSLSSSSAHKIILANTDHWETIYKLPSINLLAGVSRLKEYQAAVTALSVPIAMTLESNQILTSGSAELCAAIGITGTISLSLYSAIASNVIGFIYINQKQEKIRLGHINFWGRRKNVDFSFKKINISDNKKLGICQMISTSTTGPSYKLLPHYGQILAPDIFAQMFGES